jgi:hypothetical protein
MKCSAEIGSDATIYIPSFIKTGSDIQKLRGEYMHRQHGDLINLLLLLQNKESSTKGCSFTKENSKKYNFAATYIG